MDRAALVARFNTGINTHDMQTLESLMSDEFAFVDAAGNRYDGKPIAQKALSTLFALFPDYLNHFEQIIDTEDKVIVIGRITCSEKALEGPALWTISFNSERVAEWRVYKDTPEVREAIIVAPGVR